MEKTSQKQFNEWLLRPEGYDIEFKSSLSFLKPDYCAALSNEGGGKILVGVSDAGDVIGTKDSTGTYNKIPHELWNKIGVRIDIEEFVHPSGRVLIFHIPCHPKGKPIQGVEYGYPMRLGESLHEMDPATLKNILTETDEDFSAKIVPHFSLEDIDDDALRRFKELWAKKNQRTDYIELSNEQVLKHLGLFGAQGLNYASMVLFGKREKIDELLPCAEIIFEWRQDSKRITHDFRVTWRDAFFKIYDLIWKVINERNLRIPFQEGFVQREVFAFTEKPIREAVLNAITHRDYSITGNSIFIKASPEEFLIESPGGLPGPVTVENILETQYWRNRSIATTLEKSGLIERSGQGMDDIFSITVQDGKGLPDLSQSNQYFVRLKIPAQVKDEQFILFLEKVARERQINFSSDEIYELEKIREKKAIVSSRYREKFLGLGIIERIGKTRGARYILSHDYYAYKHKAGVYTRLVGISRDKYKELIYQHLRKNKRAKREDFQDIFPELKPQDISNLLQDLKQTKRIIREGSPKKGYWTLS